MRTPPPGYEQHRTILLAARYMFLAIWFLANSLADDEGHLDQLTMLTGS